MAMRRAVGCAALCVTVGIGACGGSGDDPSIADTSTGADDGIVVTMTTDGPKFDMSAGSTLPTGNGPEGGSEGCTEVSVSVEPVIPTIVLLVDQSGSMTEDFSGQERWAALYETLMGAGGTVETLQGDVRFGLAMYSSMDGNEGGMCPLLTEVVPALDNYDAIDAIYDRAAPIDETPTGESLALVAGTLEAFDEPGPKAIVLATDGEPDTCAEPNPQEGQPEVIAAVEAAFGAGVSTFVVSVGNEIGEAHLQQVANAGVGKAIDDPMAAPFYIALDAGDLIAAFDEIIGSFASCQIPIDGIVELDQACEGTLLLDGVELSCPVDWTMLDAMTIELLGDACDTWKDGQPHGIGASWPCGAVNIP